MNKSSWHEANKDRVNAYMREYLKDYRKKNRKKLRAAHRKWYAANKHAISVKGQRRYEQLRDCTLRKKYGIGVAEYNAMLLKQSGRCAICLTDAPGGRGRFHVDHCHDTKRVRGLLCNQCNRMVGQGKDIAIVFLAAARYLTEPTGICNS